MNSTLFYPIFMMCYIRQILLVLPETVTTVLRMVAIINRSLHNDVEFPKAKEVGITKQIWCCEQIATRFDFAQGSHQAISQQKNEMYTNRCRPSHAVMQVRSSETDTAEFK